MNIEYDTTLDDMVEFNIYAMKNHPQLRKRVIIERTMYLTISLLIIFSSLVLYLNSSSFVYIIFLACGIFLLCFYGYFSRRSQIKKRIKKLVIKEHDKIPNEEICRHKILLSETGIYATIEYGESTTKWLAITEIIQTEKYLYFFLKPGKAHIVPKRAFIDEVAFNQFAQTARMYHTKALS
ncbi:MAG: YcxB family protein [Dehalococcoidales bacterium]|nr:YcxB family protein [Dehalococcoidales bacterium]